ncbi:YARHG domain-containing protein [Reichenbachiella versicolor]|uniref:YARHG domain-containing protein n=1 Tax=Reichenbachiella versicolor TaxID=1821036 RepID=UPI000D6E8176|nr:YARHG domain-containing protein [Reichenbachiella versicolor]
MKKKANQSHCSNFLHIFSKVQVGLKIKLIPFYVLVGVFSICCSTQKKEKTISIYDEIDLVDVSQKLDSVELSTYDFKKLRLVRNKIFAKHGLIFKSYELTDFYSRFDWYNPTQQIWDVNPELSPIEIYNITLIRKIEKSLDWNDDFKQFVNLTPFIPLPLKIEDCNLHIGIKGSFNYSDSLLEKYRPEYSTILGKLYQSEDSVAMMYCYPADICVTKVFIYDKTSHVLDTITIPLNCIADQGYIATTNGVISKEYEVITETYEEEWEGDEHRKNTYKSTIQLKK